MTSVHGHGRGARKGGSLRLLLVAVAIGAVGAACSEVQEAPGASGSGDIMLDSADHVAFGFRTSITDGGVLRAEVYADTALFFDQNTRATLRQVRGEFFDEAGIKEADMTSRIASFDTRSNSLEAWGDVVINTVDGRVLRTPQIRYDRRLNQVSSDSSFVLTEPGDRVMRGVGFRADPNLRVINVLKLDEGRGGTINLSRP
ncbi:MAG TPA: LPS export ABC transporter periplasmic protein LptC [Gemmatimonadaceae bacterium]|nr:LPS export ABC transporter periplasmic protein LptC [Gemmatimonadaceae bacterium]